MARDFAIRSRSSAVPTRPELAWFQDFAYRHAGGLPVRVEALETNRDRTRTYQ